MTVNIQDPKTKTRARKPKVESKMGRKESSYVQHFETAMPASAHAERRRVFGEPYALNVADAIPHGASLVGLEGRG